MGPAGPEGDRRHVWCDVAMLGLPAVNWYGFGPFFAPGRVGSRPTESVAETATGLASARGTLPGVTVPGTNRRPDIQGLRAVAVTVVVAFHAGLPLPGGFVGVDVFFVISGFVITAMLSREWESTGTVRLGAFYLRRFKRLTPALALMVAVTLLLSVLLLSPFGQQQVAAQTAVGAMALCANWVIASVTGGYFAPEAEANPLLHTWSLSVEEQFYLVFPLLLLVGWRLGPRLRMPRMLTLAVVGGLGLASLALIRGVALGIPASSWVLGFYSPFNRAWEFAAGALLALVAHRMPSSRPLGTVLGAGGLAAVAASLFVITEDTPFPGKMTLLPVLGATLVIAGGLAHPNNPVSRMLSLAPMVRIGDWSYSWYLWHWPLIVIVGTVLPLASWVPLVVGALSLLPAVASYRWVEEPFRARAPRRRRALASAGAAIVAVPVMLAGVTWVAAERFWTPAFLDGRIAAAFAPPVGPVDEQGISVVSGFACTAPELDELIGTNGACLHSQDSPDVDVAVLGDSHAEVLFTGLGESMPEQNVAVYALRGPGMFGSPAQLDTALNRITGTPSIHTVIVSRYWSRDGLHPTDELAPLRSTVQRLTEAGRTVLVTDDVPSYPFPATACRYRVAPVLPWQHCTRPAADVESERVAYTEGLAEAIAGAAGASVLPTTHYFCDPTDCSMVADDRLLYGDGDHLNGEGSRWLAERLAADGLLPSIP